MNQNIMAAIHSKTLVEVQYHGFERGIEVYACGAARSGDEVALCYQISGGSESGKVPGWKLLKIAEMSSVEATEVLSSRGASEYAGHGKGMATIYAQRP